MTKTISDKSLAIIKATYKAKGMTKQEIDQLMNSYPKEESTKEYKELYKKKLSEIEDAVALRHDIRRVTSSALSALVSLSSLSIAKAAHTCTSPKTMCTCFGLFILAGLYSYSRFSRIGHPSKNEDKRIQKAVTKALNKLQKEKNR